MTDRSIRQSFRHAGGLARPVGTSAVTTPPTATLAGEQLYQLEDALAAIALCAQLMLRQAPTALGQRERQRLATIGDQVARATSVLIGATRPAGTESRCGSG